MQILKIRLSCFTTPGFIFFVSFALLFFFSGKDVFSTEVTFSVGSWSFNEGSGTIASDTSGFGNDGTLNSSPTWVAGVSSSALSFAGGEERVFVPDAPSLDITGVITIAAWIKPNIKTTQYVFKKGRYGLSDGYELSLSSSTGKVFVRFNQAS